MLTALKNNCKCYRVDAFLIFNPEDIYMMPTSLTHPAVPLAIGIGLVAQVHFTTAFGGLGCHFDSARFGLIAFRFGIPYPADVDHRDFSHFCLF